MSGKKNLPPVDWTVDDTIDETSALDTDAEEEGEEEEGEAPSSSPGSESDSEDDELGWDPITLHLKVVKDAGATTIRKEFTIAGMTSRGEAIELDLHFSSASGKAIDPRDMAHHDRVVVHTPARDLFFPAAGYVYGSDEEKKATVEAYRRYVYDRIALENMRELILVRSPEADAGQSTYDKILQMQQEYDDLEMVMHGASFGEPVPEKPGMHIDDEYDE
ncbi:MAG: hypothetical protein Q9183_003984 [Haloplaca sp. 2 TL-2023]